MQFLALLFGCVPLLRSLIFTEHSFLYFLFDSLNILGFIPPTNYSCIQFNHLRGHGGVSFCTFENDLSYALMIFTVWMHFAEVRQYHVSCLCWVAT